MPETAARYFIKITAVRAEKLQDISEKDCLKEGVYTISDYESEWWLHGCDKPINGIYESWPTPRKAYAALIDKINGKGTWESNPWVWVYDYELFKKHEL